MSRIHRVTALAVLVSAGACHGKSPVAPSTAQGAPRRIISSRIDGPATVAPGASVQFRLLLNYSDNTQEDASAQASWTSSNSAIVSVDRTGRVTSGVSPACGALAQDVGGVRVFTAAITQNGPGVSVALTSATLSIPAKLAGRVLDKTLTVEFPSEADYYYRGNPTFAVLDRLDAT